MGDFNTTFNFQGKPQTSSLTMDGSGAITKTPSRMHMIVHSSSTGLGSSATTDFEEIIDASGIYIKEPLLTKDPTKPWVKIDLQGLTGSTSGLSSSNYLDFSQLSNQQIVGEDIINGEKAWHIHTTLASILDNGTPGPSATLTTVAQQLGATISTFTEDVWIFEGTYYPAKIAVHESASLDSPMSTATPNPLGSYSSSSTLDETLLFTAWNSGVTIDLPPPSEVSSGLGLKI